MTATDGEAALKRFFDETPDVVLLDVGLPLLDGFEVLRRIRQVSDTPVLMLTARGEELDKVRGLEIGADDYITKPFSPLELLARIKAVLRRSELPPPSSRCADFKADDLTVNFDSQEVAARRPADRSECHRVPFALSTRPERRPRGARARRCWPGSGATSTAIRRIT